MKDLLSTFKKWFTLGGVIAALTAPINGWAEEPPQLRIGLRGFYNATSYTQNQFRFGFVPYKDAYWTQILRLNLSFALGEHVRAVTRMDLGQGWWGVNNVPPTYRPGSGSSLFDNKDTNFFLHVDQAYVWFRVPSLKMETTVGRFNWFVGNRLVLDNNYDGITLRFQVHPKAHVKFGWAKVSEGVDGLTDRTNASPDWRGNTDGRDAHLWLVTVDTRLPQETRIQFYGFFYRDGSISDGTAYIPDGLFYNRPRFTPQVTRLTVLGLAGTTQAGRWRIEYELNWLTGRDEIENTTHAGPMNTFPGRVDPLKYDINDGRLRGYNLFLRVEYQAAGGLWLGLTAGRGSGDPDPTSGPGNVVKLRTSGLFYLSEVWEDSIMPDEEGISPQGLGAPNVRAYRELENTTLARFHVRWQPHERWTFMTAFMWLQATEPIYAWTAEGPDLSRSARALGWEWDARVDYRIHPAVTLILRGGYLSPGQAALFLVNGTDRAKKAAWEIRATLLYRFRLTTGS